MGIVSRLCDAVVMSEEGRLGLSGPEVIETTMGVEEFDSRDRALVWRTVGGKHRYLLGEAAVLVDDDLAAFRAAALSLIGIKPDLSLEALEAEHARLGERLERFGDCRDALDIWKSWASPSPSGCRSSTPRPSLPPSATSEPDPWTPRPCSNACSPAAATSPSTASTSGTGHCAGTDVAVIGTVDNTPIGIELAFRMAGEVLEVVRHHPGRPILLLVDTQGQRLSHRDELLGINGYMAHLAVPRPCPAQRTPHPGARVLPRGERRLPRQQHAGRHLLRAARGGDPCDEPAGHGARHQDPAGAADGAERLLAGVRTGGGQLPAHGRHRGAVGGRPGGLLAKALAAPASGDRRRAAGEERQGRTLARAVSDRVRRDAADPPAQHDACRHDWIGLGEDWERGCARR